MSQDNTAPYRAHRVTVPYGRADLVIETGKYAKQANGAVTCQIGRTMILVAAVASEKADTTKDFFPLMVEYRGHYAAAGRFPGGFFKREGRPSDKETLSARLIDRAIRPMFPEGFRNETQIYVSLLSMEQGNLPETAALTGAAAALLISNIPFEIPIAAVRVGRLNGEFILNPTPEEIEAGELDLVVAGHKDGLNMVEAGAKELSEDLMIEALEFAHEAIRAICVKLEEFRAECGKPKLAYSAPEPDKELRAAVEKLAAPHLAEIATTYEKKAREARLAQAITEIQQALAERFPDRNAEIAAAVNHFDELAMRRRVIEKGVRADGRAPTEIRPIWGEVDSLPATHGSAVFTRGQTQALASVTLGSVEDQQKVDDLEGVTFKRFMLHYYFPSFSVGECRPPRGPGRREIGHGALAERAINPVIPPKEEFPYTIRVISDILESNGSSSMASVCAGCLALMDAGVPIRRMVAGIAMGLIVHESNYAILSDIQGIEDHCGDMDFKVTGSEQGITALQMDIKVSGVSRDVLAKALEQARAGRLFIMQKMSETLAAPRPDLKPHTPRITILHIPTEKIRDVIGPGGKIIREIVEKTGCKIDIEDDGSVYILSENQESAAAAVEIITQITAELEEGSVYTGKVTRVMDSGVIVEIFPGKDGMVHISELDHQRVNRVEDICREGDTVLVKVIEIDRARGRVRLSRRAALADQPGYEPPAGSDSGGEDSGYRRRPSGGGDRDRRYGGPRRGGDRGGDRGGRGGDRGGRYDRGDRGPRGERHERGERPERGEPRERMDAQESEPPPVRYDDRDLEE